MQSEIVIYTAKDSTTQVDVRFEDDTVWLSQKVMADLFSKDSDTIGLHLKNIFAEGELTETATTEYFSVIQTEGKRQVNRAIKHYNLDAILSVGYRVNSKRGTQFRQWATQRLKDYLVQGFAINEKRLAERQMQVETLKTGIRILSRAIESQAAKEDSETLRWYAKGLALLDDYDHEQLDTEGKTSQAAILPAKEEYLHLVSQLQSAFSSEVFAIPKDDGFESSIAQIGQSFGGHDLYPSIEEKAATLLYFIVKNHSFVDGNKRIGAACFLYFLEKNGLLFPENKQPSISNEALAALTLLVAISQPEEMKPVKRLVISILNRR